MKKHSFLATFLMVFITVSYAQKNNINSYKYILVPAQYEFQKTEDAYQVNSLTTFLFNRAGFTVFKTNETIPTELAQNSCLALKALVVNNSGLLSTKMQIKLVDCFNNAVYVTEEGTSREKDYQKAYHQAIREAFEEIESLNYSYQPVIEKKETVTITEKELPKPIVKEVVEAVDDVQVSVVVEKEALETKEKVANTEEIKQKVKEEKPAIQKKKIVSKPLQDEIKEIEIKPTALEGTYEVDKWGTCKITKTDEGFAFTAGDEHFEFAVIYPTSKPTIYIIKYAAYKQPQLAELTATALKVDSPTGVKLYKKVN
jgi:hypothetical protein